MKLLYSILLLSSLTAAPSVCAQSSNKQAEKKVKEYFANVEMDIRSNRPTLKSISIDSNKRSVKVVASSSLAYWPFTPQSLKKLYADVKDVLPSPYNKYSLYIYSENILVDNLVPNSLRSGKKDKSRLSLNIDYKGEPWVNCISKAYEASKGLQGRHIALWQSHGRFFKNDRNQWEWQRPNLYCTTEDLFTQSFVVPYVIPMLQNAGAVVYTPRERDSQRNEVIVDNDGGRSNTTSAQKSLYIEEKSRKGKWAECEQSGFAWRKDVYNDGETPFGSGTARYVNTEKKENKAFAEWIPTIPETGQYAVYVTYQTLPESVTDAKYIVFHEGGITEFKVNQKIGGGTWVYLGTFYFRKGRNATGMVILTNHSKENGVVCADAVRFGGGMGNISRGGAVSGLPRNLEGARYYAQWSGLPYSVYGGRNGDGDYADDINTRSYAINYLSGGSVYNPDEEGLGVPFEMSLAMHSDAGYSTDDEQIGTLGIYTTAFNNGKLNDGVSRMASRDLIDMTISQIQADVQAEFKQPWTRRAMWDRNYSETRLPAVPSAIVEMLSHQNFADMRYGHDPNFKFTVGRAIYKATLKFVSEQHGTDYVVQPLPVSHFAMKRDDGNKVTLSWEGEDDITEPTAKPKEYIVYTSTNRNGFDNGVKVHGTSHTVTLTPGIIYSFRITAANAGGESFPSETLSAYIAPKEKGQVLIVNGFNRLCGPAVINTDTECGFDINRDPGVAYIYNQSLCGAQLVSKREQAGKEGDRMLGYSGSELEGMKIAGNTFDYPYVHGEAIRAAGGYSFVSCSDEAVEDGMVNINEYKIVDIISGLEKDAPENLKYYKSFSQKMQQELSAYCKHGGALLVSGSYIASDMTANSSQRSFTKDVLHYSYEGKPSAKSDKRISGMSLQLTIPRKANEASYAVTSPDCIAPTGGAFSTLVYSADNTSAAIAYDGTDYKVFAMGFPFESIEESEGRAKLMAAILNFLANH